MSRNLTRRIQKEIERIKKQTTTISIEDGGVRFSNEYGAGTIPRINKNLTKVNRTRSFGG